MNQERIKELFCLLVDEYYSNKTNPVIEKSNPPSPVSELEEEEEKEDNSKMNLGFITYWNKTSKDLSRYTHLSYAFLDIDNNGNPNSKEIDTIQVDFDGKKGISIGGSVGSGKVMRILGDDNKRKRFIERVLTSMNDSGYDYLNYDLEYPSQDLIEKVLSETKEYIINNRLDIEISVCLACWRGFVKPYINCNQYVDWVELMVYDDKKIVYFAKEALQLLSDYGYPDSKIIIGDSLDKNGIPDTPETLQFKDSIEHKYGGRFLWEVSMYEGKEEEKGGEVDEVINNETVFKDKWDNPHREMKKAREVDIYDNRTYFRGTGKVSIEKGIMTLSGSQPRLYVYTLNIQNVEAQVDFMKVGNSGVGWSGGNIGVRSGVEGHGTDHSTAHTYYFRLKHGQQLDFYKEEEHGKATGVIHTRKFGLETGIWYRMMFRCYNLSNNKIKLEGYINGNLELEYTDTSKVMYDARGLVFIRNTSVDEAKYKNLSIKQYKLV